MNESASQPRCICGKIMESRVFTDSFMRNYCDECGSSNFVLLDDAVKCEFNYNDDNKKYSDESYLSGGELRWSHRVISRYDWSGKKVLEVGCFNGFFLFELQKNGADVYGFDLNKKAIQVGAKNFNLKDRLFSDFDEALKKGPYDVILMVDLLEHLDEPREMIIKVRNHMGPNGTIVVAGPTADRLFRDKSDFPPHHKWWFSTKGLVSLLDGCCFKLVNKSLQRDGMLLIRNLIGRVLSGYKKEFYGEGVIAPGIVKNPIVNSIYELFTVVVSVPLKVFGITYCSTVLRFELDKNIDSGKAE